MFICLIYLHYNNFNINKNFNNFEIIIKKSEIQELKQGIYGLSNASLDYPWGKLTRGKEKFTQIVSKAEELTEEELEKSLLDLLRLIFLKNYVSFIYL